MSFSVLASLLLLSDAKVCTRYKYPRSTHQSIAFLKRILDTAKFTLSFTKSNNTWCWLVLLRFIYVTIHTSITCLCNNVSVSTLVLRLSCTSWFLIYVSLTESTVPLSSRVNDEVRVVAVTQDYSVWGVWEMCEWSSV